MHFDSHLSLFFNGSPAMAENRRFDAIYMHWTYELDPCSQFMFAFERPFRVEEGGDAALGSARRGSGRGAIASHEYTVKND